MEAEKKKDSAPTPASEAKTQRSLAICAVRVSGHVGKQSSSMGDYVLDACSPQRGKNVYSLVAKRGPRKYLHRAMDGTWVITGSTAHMFAGKCTGRIVSTTVSASPLGLKWKCANNGFHCDPMLTVTEITASTPSHAPATGRIKVKV